MGVTNHLLTGMILQAPLKLEGSTCSTRFTRAEGKGHIALRSLVPHAGEPGTVQTARFRRTFRDKKRGGNVIPKNEPWFFKRKYIFIHGGVSIVRKMVLDYGDPKIAKGPKKNAPTFGLNIPNVVLCSFQEFQGSWEKNFPSLQTGRVFFKHRVGGKAASWSFTALETSKVEKSSPFVAEWKYSVQVPLHHFKLRMISRCPDVFQQQKHTIMGLPKTNSNSDVKTPSFFRCQTRFGKLPDQSFPRKCVPDAYRNPWENVESIYAWHMFHQVTSQRQNWGRDLASPKFRDHGPWKWTAGNPKSWRFGGRWFPGISILDKSPGVSFGHNCLKLPWGNLNNHSSPHHQTTKAAAKTVLPQLQWQRTDQNRWKHRTILTRPEANNLYMGDDIGGPLYFERPNM